MQVTVPARFWEDHVERGCRCHMYCPDRETHEATIESLYGQQTSKGYVVELTDLDREELLNDAQFYVEMARTYEAGLVSSARATVKRLEKAME